MKKNKNILIGIIICLCLIITFVIIYFCFRSNNKQLVSVYNAKENNEISVIGDKYIIEKDKRIEDGSNYVKVSDIKTNLLYEGNIEYNNIEMGIDNNLYFYNIDSDSRKFTLYKLDNDKIVKVYDMVVPGYENGDFRSVSYRVGEDYYLLGFYENKGNESYIYSLDGKKNLIGNYYLDNKVMVVVGSYTTFNKNNMVIKNNNNLYGIYNIKNNKVTVESKYNKIFYSGDNFIVKLNNKYGVIDSNGNVLVDIIYDYIEFKDDFYAVCKDKKVAIMNNKLDIITGFDFDYSDYNNMIGIPVHSFSLDKVGNYYTLILGDTNKMNNGEFYDEKVYLIDKNGKYKLLDYDNIRDNNVIYSVTKDKDYVVIFDNDLNELYKIKYDVESKRYFTVRLINDDTLKICDDYYDYKSGKKLDKVNDYLNKDFNINISYNNNKNIYEIDNIKYEFESDRKLNILDNNSAYICDDNKYIYIENK